MTEKLKAGKSKENARKGVCGWKRRSSKIGAYSVGLRMTIKYERKGRKGKIVSKIVKYERGHEFLFH